MAESFSTPTSTMRRGHFVLVFRVVGFGLRAVSGNILSTSNRNPLKLKSWNGHFPSFSKAYSLP